MTNEGGVGKPEKKPLLPRWLKFLLMLLGFLFLVSALLWVIADISTRDALEAEIAELRAQGYPTTLEELEWLEVPPEENAALVYGQVFAQLQPLDDRCWDILLAVDDPTEPGALEPEDLAYLEAHVAKNEKALALLHQAAQMSRCRFPTLTPSQRRARASGPWSEVRQTTWVVTQGAMLVAVERGRGERALGYWLDSVALSRALEDHQSLIADLVRVACLRMSLRSLEGLLGKDLLAEAALQRLLEALDGLDARTSFAASMRAEIPLFRKSFASYSGALAAYAAFQRGFVQQKLTWRDRAVDAGIWLCGTWLFRPARQHDERLSLRFLAEVASLTERPFHQVRAQLDQLNMDLGHIPRYALISRHHLSGYLYGPGMQARHEARVKCARAAVALELYRKRHGTYPETLPAVVPAILAEVPIDPFDGQPLRYIKEDGRVAVYSVGKNLRDDGGSREKGLSHRAMDIVFTVRRAPAPTEESDDE